MSKSIEEVLGQAAVMTKLVQTASEQEHEDVMKDCPFEGREREAMSKFLKHVIQDSFFKGASLGALGITASVLTEKLKNIKGEQPSVQDFDIQFFANGVRKVSSVPATSFESAVERIKNSVKYAGSQLTDFKQLVAV